MVVKVQALSDSDDTVTAFPAMAPGVPAWHHSLLTRCAEGDEAAWAHLYRQYGERARRFLLRMGVESTLVDDTCQEVFLQAFRYLPRFRGECSFQTWLYRICASEARRSRQRARLNRLVCALLMKCEQEAFSSGEIGEESAARLVQRALSSLEEHERLVFVLYELEGLSGKAVAEVAGCPVQTVWSRLHYARRAFRSYVLSHGGSP